MFEPINEQELDALIRKANDNSQVDKFINFGGFKEKRTSPGAKKLQDMRRQISIRFDELKNAEQAVRADATLSPEIKRIKMHDLGRNRRDWVSEYRARAEVAALKELSERQQKIDSLYRPQSSDRETRSIEIRQHLREMQLGERIEAIRKALMKPDENKDVIVAIATANQNLSGAIHLHHAECRQKIAEMEFPEDVSAISEIKSELDKISDAHNRFDDLTFDRFIRDGEELSKNHKKSKALLSVEADQYEQQTNSEN